MKKLYILFLLCSFMGFSQSPGDIVITEIMQNPSLVSDDFGEWFEVYNTTGNPIDLNGWTITDDPSGSNPNVALIDASVIVPAGGYATLGRGGNTDPTAADYNGGLTYDFVYDAGFLMSNGSDEVILQNQNLVTIDAVFYDNGATFPDPSGASMQLDPSILDATANDDGTNWCQGSTDYNGTDLGSPAMANPSCVPVCQTFLSFNPDTVCDSINPGDSDDTYTVTLDYNDAATGETFVVSTMPSGFTIGGDDPSMVANGTIVISGVTEGTDITVFVSNIADGGLCDLSRDVFSPICAPAGAVELELRGVIDFGLGGSGGKAVHLMATADIADLSEYSVAVASNGGGSFGASFTFPQIAVANGEHILLARNLVEMEAYITTAGYNLFDYQIEATTSVTQNGDDAIGLFKNANEVEVFGDPNVDGTGEAWEYTDSWGYKDVSGAVWPMDWSYGTVDCTDNTTTIFDSTCLYPFLESLSNEQFTTIDFSLYPNPVRDGLVNIISNNNTIDNVEIFDMMGRNVLSNNNVQTSLDVSALKSGVYLMKVTSNNQSKTTKLIIN